MPEIIALVGGLAASGTIGGGGSSPKPVPASTATTPAQQQLTQNQQKALINEQAPNVVSQTSGLTNPDYVAQISQLLSGTAGQSGAPGAAQDVIAKVFGLQGGAPSGGASGFTPAGATASSSASASPTSPVSLSDFVNSFLK